MSDFKQTWKEQFSSADFQRNTRGIEKSINEAVGTQILDNTTTRVQKPYDSLTELPDAVKKLPKHAQEIFRSAFNSAYKNPPTGQKAEEYAFKVAWSAVKRAGFKKALIDCLEEAKGLLEKSMVIFKSYEKPVEKSFTFMIEKAFPVDENGKIIEVSYRKFKKDASEGEIDLDKMYIEGIASTTNVDHDQERMSAEALVAMADKINKHGVPLMNEHQKTWDANLGNIFKAWIDERDQLHIKAKLDKDSSRAIDLYKAIKKGLQVGLSVAGLVKRSAQELVEGLGKKLKTFYDVALKEISVTNRPSNFDTWLVAKHYTGSLEEHLFKEPHPFYEEYLQNNPLLNWHYEIAKSVAEVTNKLMPEEIIKEEKVEEKAADTKETTSTTTEEKAVPPISSTTEVAADTKETTTTSEEKKEISDTETSEQKKKAIEEKSANENIFKDMTDAFKSLTEKIGECLKAIKDSSTDTTTEPTPAKKAAESVSSTTPTETKCEEKAVETTSETTTKSATEIRVDAEYISKEIEKKMAETGKRLVGPLVDVVEKMMAMPLKRKGIASEKAYMMEKNIANDPYREKATPNEKENLEKDIKDEKVSFQDMFKKHYSSFEKK